MSPAYRPRRLAQSSPAAGVETVAYTVPAGQLAIVKQVMVANTVAGTVQVSISLAGSRIVSATPVPGKSVLVFDLSQVLNSGDTISVLADAAGATFTVSGVESTSAEMPESGLELWLDGVDQGVWPRLHLHQGAGVALFVAGDQVANEVDVTVAVAGLAATMSYVHAQGTALATWVINHNLGFYPNATVVASDGSNVEGDMTYPSINVMQIAFAGALSGTAYLS